MLAELLTTCAILVSLFSGNSPNLEARITYLKHVSVLTVVPFYRPVNNDL